MDYWTFLRYYWFCKPLFYHFVFCNYSKVLSDSSWKYNNFIVFFFFLPISQGEIINHVVPPPILSLILCFTFFSLFLYYFIFVKWRLFFPLAPPNVPWLMKVCAINKCKFALIIVLFAELMLCSFIKNKMSFSDSTLTSSIMWNTFKMTTLSWFAKDYKQKELNFKN